MAHLVTTAPRVVGLTLGVLLAPLLALACSSSDGASAISTADASAPDSPPARECTDPGATRCAGLAIETCEARGAGTAWGASAACPGDQTCREDACQDPTAAQRTQADSIDVLVDHLTEVSAWHQPVDPAAVKLRERTAILRGDGSEGTWFGAAWRALHAYPQGHQALYSAGKVCGTKLPSQNASRFGVCGRPGGGGLAITSARAGNLLGLEAGDVVVAAGADAGEALLEASYLRPVCGSVMPSKPGRLASGAASFFGTIPAGTKLTVKGKTGATRDVVVPAGGDSKALDCTDPFGRDRRLYAEAKTRPDGVAVIRLPSFYPFDRSAPTTSGEFDAFEAAYQAEIQAVFDTVKTAPAIVWDVRGNTGGMTRVGLAIASGFVGARAGELTYCRDRNHDAPDGFNVLRYASYALTPGGPFAYPGKVAVVSDGLAYSAGDYFPMVSKTATSAIVVGTASAGAFGGGRSPVDLVGPPSLIVSADGAACFDAATNSFLEGAPPPPTVEVAYDPADLAAGKDTVLERAVKELGL